MGEDHLDKELSVSAQITTTGVEARARSRTIAAIDRLIGSAIDRCSAPIEVRTEEIRAQSNARIKFIETLGELGIESVKANPKALAKAIENNLDSILRRHQNKEAVIAASLEDLRQAPPTVEEANKGDEMLTEAFLDRFERYAEEASEEQLRDKWGRVLAQEIRRPGTFSLKVMRVVDELDSDTALLFERICQYRSENSIVKCLTGELTFSDMTDLVSAGLLVEPGFLGQGRFFSEITVGDGAKLLAASVGKAMVAFSSGATIQTNTNDVVPPIVTSTKGLAIPSYILTDAGYTISSILQDRQDEMLMAYIERLASVLGATEIYEFRRLDNGSLQLAKTHRPRVVTQVQ
jgi:hypothetical protein